MPVALQQNIETSNKCFNINRLYYSALNPLLCHTVDSYWASKSDRGSPFDLGRQQSKNQSLQPFLTVCYFYLLDFYSFYDSWLWRSFWRIYEGVYNIDVLRVLWHNRLFDHFFSGCETSRKRVRLLDVCYVKV